ncbi:MAG: hypothetical protein ACXABN_15385 [Candidatus Thorarchaeota archaeon]|jgi:hypothetical protein
MTAPTYETFTLDKADEKYGSMDDPTTVTVKQASQGQHEQRQSLFAKLEQRWNQLEPDEVALVQTVSMEEVKKLEVYLSLVDSNFENEEGKPLFPTRNGKDGMPELAMSKPNFMKAWSKLLPDVAKEIHEKVLKVNPLWRGQVGEAL